MIDMMNLKNCRVTKEIQLQIRSLIKKSHFSLTKKEYEHLIYYDFGLGHFDKEGVTIIDLLNTERLRITLMILLPYQTLPEHFHPSYPGEKGKEETVRVLFGETRLYIEGETNASNMVIPDGKELFYTVKHEINLIKNQQYTINHGTRHWFQGGEKGSVNLEFQNTVDEKRNRFTDPNINIA